jgi:hypothetical protein
MASKDKGAVKVPKKAAQKNLKEKRRAKKQKKTGK